MWSENAFKTHSEHNKIDNLEESENHQASKTNEILIPGALIFHACRTRRFIRL